MNSIIQELTDWRSYRKFCAKKGIKVENYYIRRLREAPLDAVIVLACGVLVLFITIGVAILNQR